MNRHQFTLCSCLFTILIITVSAREVKICSCLCYRRSFFNKQDRRSRTGSSGSLWSCCCEEPQLHLMETDVSEQQESSDQWGEGRKWPENHHHHYGLELIRSIIHSNHDSRPDICQSNHYMMFLISFNPDSETWSRQMNSPSLVLRHFFRFSLIRGVLFWGQEPG